MMKGIFPNRHSLKRRPRMVVAVGLMIVAGMASPSGGAELKVAVIDPERVANETVVGKRMKAALSDYLENRQKAIDQDEEALRVFEEELRTQGPLLNAEARKEKQEIYQRQVIAYQQKISEINRDLQSRRNQESDRYAKLLRAAVALVAKRHGYTLVLAKLPESGLVLFHHPSLDVTEQAIQELDRLAMKEKPPRQ